MRIRIFQRGKISGSRTVDHQIFSTYTFTKCQIFVLRKNSGESISYPFAFGIEGLSNSGFRAKFQKIVMCVAFSIKFAKTNQKFAENSEFCENYSLLFKIIHWCP